MERKTHLDLTGIPKELQLIMKLLKNDETEAISRESFEDIDWNLFIDLAMHHRVYPVLYTKINMLNGKLDVPPFVLEKLYAMYKRNTFQMLHLSAEMGFVSELFSRRSINLLFLKGPNLGHDLYGDVSRRTSNDLDILVPIERLEEAEELLTKQGYEKDDYIKTVLNDWKWRHHHVTYFHPRKGIKLEIHWRLNPGPAKEPGFHELWKRRDRSGITSTPIYTLGKEDLFFFLASHGARHGWSRLRWLLDISRLMEQDLNWQEIHRLFKKYRSLPTCGQGVILADQLLSTKLPNKVKELFITKQSKLLADQALYYQKEMINLHSNPVPKEVARYHKHHLFSLMATPQKFFFMISFLYPYPEDADTLPLPKWLHFLYFPLRPFLWAWRKTLRT